jgi:ABC-type transport system involved in cytochrome c biogenesis permease subunit
MTFVMGVWYLISYFAKPNSEVLKTLDACNLVMLQLAFWILGIGIITGALWADVSWGRPWGWDPKETFALVTWIVYLIIIHVRFVTAGQNRALTTGILSIIGFGVMLFNWIGVNFFLVGLHSYA